MKKFKGRKRSAAAATTAIIGFVVLLPIGIAGTYAAVEGSRILRNISPGYIAETLGDFRKQFELEIPSEEALSLSEIAIEDLVNRTALTEKLDAVHASLAKS